MNKFTALSSILLAGLLGAAGVQAQSYPAASTSDMPTKAGEQSTMTNGVPNAKTTNSPVSETPTPTQGALRQETQGMGAAAATSPIAPKPGEASTMAQGKPNMDPNAAPAKMSRSDVVNELMTRRARFEAERRALGKGGVMYSFNDGWVARH